MASYMHELCEDAGQVPWKQRGIVPQHGANDLQDLLHVGRTAQAATL